jgi:hypothetical protein
VYRIAAKNKGREVMAGETQLERTRSGGFQTAELKGGRFGKRPSLGRRRATKIQDAQEELFRCNRLGRDFRQRLPPCWNLNRAV